MNDKEDLYECETTERILREEDGKYPQRAVKTWDSAAKLKELQVKMQELKRAVYSCEIALRLIELEPDKVVWRSDLTEQANKLNIFTSLFTEPAEKVLYERFSSRSIEDA